jgi:endonuclease/exonuclease/phosphatase family metal-dependent hydrolase/ribosomal protein S28E/S33
MLSRIASAQVTTPGATDINIMTFNIWRGGELVNFGQVAAAIEAADADIVGLQEAEGNIRQLADALDWPYANERTQIISRFPLIDPPGADGRYLFAQTAPGEIVAVANVHLPSDPYGPYEVRDGAALEDVLELETSTRLAALQPYLDVLPGLADSGIPVLLVGDFNTPSHLDWTQAAIQNRPEARYPVEWPVTLAAEAIGFVDTFRAVHPDPIEYPGITWTYGYPFPRLNADEVIDRIDLIFAANIIEVLDSRVVGDPDMPNTDIGISPYPSDHRAVVSTVRVIPAAPPLFVAVDDRTVERGDSIVVRYQTLNGESADRIAIAPVSGSVEDILMWLPPYEASFSGSVTFGSTLLEPGQYDVFLIDAEDTELSRNSFWVIDPDALPAIRTEQGTYAVGEPITVSWSSAPAYRWDWVAIYSVDDPDLYNNYWAYLYTGATVEGWAVFDASALGDEMLPAGDYVARLLLDDGFEVLAEAEFAVSE